MELVLLLWSLSGILMAWYTTPQWMFEDDWFGFFIMTGCGAIAGPIGGLFWYINSPRWDEDWGDKKDH